MESLKLFIWEDENISGIKFALAYNIEEAKKLILSEAKASFYREMVKVDLFKEPKVIIESSGFII